MPVQGLWAERCAPLIDWNNRVACVADRVPDEALRFAQGLNGRSDFKGEPLVDALEVLVRVFGAVRRAA